VDPLKEREQVDHNSSNPTPKPGAIALILKEQKVKSLEIGRYIYIKISAIKPKKLNTINK